MKMKSFVLACLALNVASAFASEALFLAPANVKNSTKNSSQERNKPPPPQTVSAISADTAMLGALHGLRLNPLAAKAHELQFQLPDGEMLDVKRSQTYLTKSGSQVWIGRHQNGGKNLAALGDNESILVIRDGRITGSIRHQRKYYQIRAGADGQHSLAEIDTSQVSPDHDETDYLNTPIGHFPRSNSKANEQNLNFKMMAPAPTEIPIVRVMVHYTSAAKNGAGSTASAIVDLIDLSVAETNQSYKNSNVNVQIELAHVAEVDYVEDASLATNKSRYAGLTDGYMDEIHTQRKTYAADVGILVQETVTDACGSANKIGADAASAFAIVKRSCSSKSLSFGHELGHLFGARHNIEKDSGGTAYAHGYQHPQNEWRTVMAYPCTSTCPRLPYWSNPDIKYNDNDPDTVDDPMGVSASANNARMLSENAARLAAFLSPPNKAPVANAGADKSVTLPNSLSLVGTASDDGLPSGSSLSYQWSKVSGPGTVTFANGSTASATASFSTNGVYVLRLSVSDGDKTGTDDVTVTVSATSSVTSLSSGVAVTGIALAKGAGKMYSIVVPAGKTSLVFKLSGGTGDGDIYTKFNAQPTITSYSAKSSGSTNTETITISNPSAGTHYLLLNAYAAISGVSLMATLK